MGVEVASACDVLVRHVVGEHDCGVVDSAEVPGEDVERIEVVHGGRISYLTRIIFM